MSLIILEESMKGIYSKVDHKPFPELLRDLRDALGLKLYKAAEFIGIAPARLKNLETGYFRIMPSDIELNAISQLYDLKISTLKTKAQNHVKNRELAKKVQLNEDMQNMQQE